MVKIMNQNIQQLQAASNAASTARAKDCAAIPDGVPTSGGGGKTAWRALGMQVAQSQKWLAYRDGAPLDRQYDAQVARLTKQRLPDGVEIRHIIRSARYLVVTGNAVCAESALRAAGYPDAFAGCSSYVLLDYVPEVAHA